MYKKTNFLVLLIFLVLFFIPNKIIASTSYQLSDLGPPANLSTSYAEGLNNKDQIVGHTYQSGSYPNNAFIYENGIYNLLPLLPGGTHSEAYDINDAGKIVGYSDGFIDGTNQSGAVMWDKGNAIYLGNLGMGGEARAINNKGQVTGFSYNARSSTADLIPFIWDKGIMTALPTLGGRNNFAYDINEQGVVVGAVETSQGLEAVYWKNGTLYDLGFSGIAYGINNKGQIVGTSNAANQYNSDYRAFLWDNGVITDLGTIDNIRAEAYKINESSQIVGASNYLSGIANQSTYHGFIWQNGIITDLGAINGSSFAKNINAKGDVVGYSEYAPFNYHPVLWNKH
jgi:probable HAF family extracellular repeat protein